MDGHVACFDPGQLVADRHLQVVLLFDDHGLVSRQRPQRVGSVDLAPDVVPVHEYDLVVHGDDLAGDVRLQVVREVSRGLRVKDDGQQVTL